MDRIIWSGRFQLLIGRWKTPSKDTLGSTELSIAREREESKEEEDYAHDHHGDSTAIMMGRIGGSCQ